MIIDGKPAANYPFQPQPFSVASPYFWSAMPQTITNLTVGQRTLVDSPGRLLQEASDPIKIHIQRSVYAASFNHVSDMG